MQKHSMKGLYQRGRMWWYRHTPFPGAPQVRVALGTDNEGDAMAAVLELEKTEPLAESKEFLTELEHYFATGIANKRLSPFTVDTRRYAVKDFAAVRGIARLSDVTVDNIERWLDDLRGRGFVPISVDAYYMHLRGFCVWLTEQNKLRENPCRKVKLGKAVVRVRTNFLTKDKIREVIAKAPNDELRFILYCGFHAGLRSLEIAEARPEWFRLSDGTKRGCVRVAETPTYRPKDKEERTIPLSAEFEAFLRAYLPTLPAGAKWVFRPEVLPKKGRLRRTSFRHGFVLFMRSLGLRCSPHDMRRSFVSNKLIDDSSLIFKLARWTGANVVTLQKHYAHLLADDEDIDVGL